MKTEMDALDCKNDGEERARPITLRWRGISGGRSKAVPPPRRSKVPATSDISQHVCAIGNRHAG